jgi:signal transduction histidine kinase
MTNGADHIDITALLQDVVLEILQDSRGRVRIDVEAEDQLPEISGVQPEMRAILHALLTNAVEASPDGGQVTVRAQSRGIDGVRIEIDDEGPGIPPEIRERLFTPHLTTKANGTGLGLFLAHRIVSSRYGGSLSIEDNKPQGTRAVVEITHRRSGANG